MRHVVDHSKLNLFNKLWYAKGTKKQEISNFWSEQITFWNMENYQQGKKSILF